MPELNKRIKLIIGEDRARFPYCNGLFLKGKDLHMLVDAGMGKRQIDKCLAEGVDVLILSHCHYDHRSTIGLLTGVPVWCHEAEVPYIESAERYFEGMGYAGSGIDMIEMQRGRPFVNLRVQRELHDGETIDLGGLTVEVIHAPGHTPGHLAFSLEDAALLFTADVALTQFGPFYGNAFADIDDSIAAIRKLADRRPAKVLTSHAGPFTENIPGLFADYEAIIYQKEEKLFNTLGKSCRIDDLTGRNLFFPFYYEPVNILRWLERLEIEKHLYRLEQQGMIRKEGDLLIKQ